MSERAPRSATPPAVSAARTERVPPHSDEEERGLLGSILMDAPRVLDLCGERRLRAEALYNPVHRILFEALAAMHERMSKVDLLTVVSHLRDHGELEQIGGEAYLIQLVDQTPTVEHAAYYIEVILQKFILRTIIDRARQMAEECYTGGVDAMEVLGRAEQMVLEIGNLQVAEQQPWPELVKTVMGEIEDILQNPGELTGISTGFRSLDQILLGMQKGDMIVLAARPSMGKTSLAMNIAENVAAGRNVHSGYGSRKHGPLPVGVFSLEMSRESLVRRMLCSRAEVSWEHIVHGFPRSNDHGRVTQAAGELMKAPIFVDDTAGLDVLELRARARRMKKMHGIEFIVIDYLQMLNYRTLAKEGRQRETQGISGAVKAMAKELRVPVLVLSQLNRSPETRDKKGVPKLSDLRDSGSIEQDADVVIMLRRPIKNKDDPKYDENNPGLVMVDVAKQRNGRTGEIEMRFDDQHTNFQDSAHGPDADVPIEPSPGGVDE